MVNLAGIACGLPTATRRPMRAAAPPAMTDAVKRVAMLM
jgi:hypothetical protein